MAASKRHPSLARTDVDSGDRFYPWKGEAFWSVTTLIGGGIPKYALAPWYGKVVAELVVTEILERGPYARAHPLVRRWTKSGIADVIARQAAGELKSIKLEKLTPVDLALRWLKGAPARVRDAAAEIGSDVHTEAEDHVLRLALDATAELQDAEIPTPWPEHLLGYERSFRTFIEEWNPAYIATEATVFNRPQAYAGTLDAIIRLSASQLLHATVRAGGVLPEWLKLAHDRDEILTAVMDYKSGRQLHPEVGLQLAAYSRAEFVGLADGVTEVELPHIDIGLGLHLTPTGYHLRLVRIDDPIYQAFLYAREIYRFQKEIAATVLGPDLAPQKDVEA